MTHVYILLGHRCLYVHSQSMSCVVLEIARVNFARLFPHSKAVLLTILEHSLVLVAIGPFVDSVSSKFSFNKVSLKLMTFITSFYDQSCAKPMSLPIFLSTYVHFFNLRLVLHHQIISDQHFQRVGFFNCFGLGGNLWQSYMVL